MRIFKFINFITILFIFSLLMTIAIKQGTTVRAQGTCCDCGTIYDPFYGTCDMPSGGCTGSQWCPPPQIPPTNPPGGGGGGGGGGCPDPGTCARGKVWDAVTCSCVSGCTPQPTICALCGTPSPGQQVCTDSCTYWTEECGATPTPTRTPTPSPTLTLTPTPTINRIYGWVYRETNNRVVRSEEGGALEPLLADYLVNLTGAQTGSTTTLGSPISGLLANYLFAPLAVGVYDVELAVTPTGSVLFIEPTSTPGARAYTNPQKDINVGGGDVATDFPFVTTTPVPAPTGSPTPTPTATPPPIDPTPTSILPSPPATCITLPTPALKAPAHQLCTNTKPDFVAFVVDPNADNAWAHFYSNSFEKFSRIGSPKIPPGGDSTWTPPGAYLNTTGSYWWTAYTESSTCPKSADAPAQLLDMDFLAPPKPQSPTCTMIGLQNLTTGECAWNCSWSAVSEAPFASCNTTTTGYYPSFRTAPGGGVNPWEPGWKNSLSETVVTGDGQLLYAKVKARDGLSNESAFSDEAGFFTCPRINYAATPTPGAPTATPTVTPTPTITPTPTPGDWTQVKGGDAYQKSYNYPVPANKYFLTNLVGDSYNSGIAWSGLGSWSFGFGNLSATNRKAAVSLSNAYDFTYFVEALKNKEKVNITDTTTVGTAAKLDTTHTIYSYSGGGYYILDTAFTPKTSVTIFLISGSLEITGDFTIPAGYTVVFIVNGNIYIGGGVREIPGLYITSQTFTVAAGSGRFTLDGMVYAKNLSLNRAYRNLDNPAYEFVYQPQYMTALLPYLGRSEVNWQEVKP